MTGTREVRRYHRAHGKTRSCCAGHTVLLACCLFSQYAFGAQQLTLNTAFGAPFCSVGQTGFFDRLINEAFRRNGVDVTIQSLPGERALINANEGIDDGDGLRILELNTDSDYPNLVRVPEKIIDVDFVVFTNGLDISIDGWQSLTPYSVGIVWGWKILERNIVNTQSLVKVKTPRLLMQLLKNNRTELIVVERLTGLAIVREPHFRGLKVIEPPLVSKSLYLYLHRKHETLVPKVAHSLRDMKRDGTYERIKQDSLSTFLQPQQE